MTSKLHESDLKAHVALCTRLLSWNFDVVHRSICQTHLKSVLWEEFTVWVKKKMVGMEGFFRGGASGELGGASAMGGVCIVKFAVSFPSLLKNG